ncbi:MAG: acyl carrier protein [Nonomuraea sp.]|nr:acyl carrier protein [Nonomuraea sp.]NUP65516.1 acyl carrier protein [Nonomuraea sp.]NUP81135.1 acyl carrier protein [Nonomuraea sp.]NUS06789.1 acyl carrier protein [Nonomuraea sp.]NUT42367.1 acyl carrier protein [Thermoactinospora sp.]
MSNERILAEFAEIVHEVVGIPAAEVQPGAHLRDDLDIDSLSLVEIMVAVEEKFGVSTPDEIAADLETVGAVLAHIGQSQSVPA